jgi:hypothetical protein
VRKEAGANRRNVEGDAVVDAERRLDTSRTCREGLVRGRSGKDDEAYLFRGHSGGGERLARRFCCERSSGLAVADEVACFDAGPLDDPFMSGVDAARGQVCIGDSVQREAKSRFRR